MGRAIPIDWTPEQLAWIEAHRALSYAEAYATFLVEFPGHVASFGAYCGLLKRKGWNNGRRTRFGDPSGNRGVPFPKGHSHGAGTRFRPGQVPANHKPVGHERMTKGGYVMVNVEQRNPWTGRPRTYRLKHLVEWEKVHGPIPEGMCLKCLGDKGDASPANWTMVSRGVLPRLNNRGKGDFDHAPEELKPTILAIARLEQAAYVAETPVTGYAATGRKRKEMK